VPLLRTLLSGGAKKKPFGALKKLINLKGIPKLQAAESFSWQSQQTFR
jgi:hypothetical protein